MKKGLLVITALLIAVVLPMSIAAQEKDIEVKVEVIECEHGQQGKSIHCDHGQGESVHAKCDIAPEIALKIQKLKLELKIKNLELEKKQTDIHKKIYSAYLEEKPDGKKIKKLTKAMLAVKAELMANQHEHFMAVRKLVPAENFKMFMSHQGHGAKMGKGMQGKMGHGSMSGCTHAQGMRGHKGDMSGCTHGSKSCCTKGKGMQGCKSGMKGCSHGGSMKGCSHGMGDAHHKGMGKCPDKGDDCDKRIIKVIKKIKE